MVSVMKTVYDVRQLLKRFGTYIYTSERLGDLELMEFEVKELYESGFVNAFEYTQSLLILRREKRHTNLKKDE